MCQNSLVVSGAGIPKRKWKSITLSRVYTLNSFPRLSKSPVPEGQLQQWRYVSDLGLAGNGGSVTLLIGQDNPSALTPLDTPQTPQPEKFRIVFDCAAQYSGTSLNNETLQGPDITNQLIGVLTRFHEKPVAVMADIEAMFHQVKVPAEHRDALSFLWWKDGDLEQEPEIYRMTVHLFGGAWSPSCASFALRCTATDNQDT